MERVSVTELQATARAVDALVYVAGVVGVVAGAMLLRDDELVFAVTAWVLTFLAGALLRLAAACARALSQLLVRSERIEAELGHLAVESPPRREGPAGDRGAPPDPWGRWGGWH